MVTRRRQHPQAYTSDLGRLIGLTGSSQRCASEHSARTSCSRVKVWLRWQVYSRRNVHAECDEHAWGQGRAAHATGGRAPQQRARAAPARLTARAPGTCAAQAVWQHAHAEQCGTQGRPWHWCAFKPCHCCVPCSTCLPYEYLCSCDVCEAGCCMACAFMCFHACGSSFESVAHRPHTWAGSLCVSDRCCAAASARQG